MVEATKKGVRFEPVNSAHAITETVFAFEFSSPFAPESVDRLLELETQADINEELPAFKRIQTEGFLLKADAQGIEFQERVQKGTVGILLQRMRPDGTPEWGVQASEDSIILHCLEYSTWSEVWARVQLYFQAILAKIIPSDIVLNAITLKYVDQFVFQGDYSTEYNPLLLFNEKTKFIHPSALRESGSRWHCHTGWFAPYKDAFECLNQLNIDTAILQNGNHRTKIEHNQMIRNVNININELLGSASLDNYMSYMHKENKNIVRDLLNPQMAKRISL